MAFETYATGEWSLQRLLDELTRRGLETIGNGKRPARPLYLSHLHKLLTHPYYKGIVRYRGGEYRGRHQPLVNEETWQRVQDVLAAHNQAGERSRTHSHYLKGSLFCGNPDCRSRLIITHARSRSGRIYPYYVCSGRHSKRTNCTFKAVLIDELEDMVIEHYAVHQLTARERDALGQTLSHELSALRAEAAVERDRLLKRQRRLLHEREKLLQAHYADAVPLDLLKSEQNRIRAALAHVQERLDATDYQHDLLEANLKAALELVTDVQSAYAAAPNSVRRQLNQALFTRIYVYDGDLTSELAEPFNTLLSPQVRELAASPRPEAPVPVPEPDWKVWEASYNEGGAPVAVGASRTSPPAFSGGLNYETLVAPGGVEPPHADSKSAALSAELRGRAPAL